MNVNKFSKLLIVLALVVVFFSIFTRLLSNSETLYEYSQKNIQTKSTGQTHNSTTFNTNKSNSENKGNKRLMSKLEQSTNSMIVAITNDVIPTAKKVQSFTSPKTDRVTYIDGFYYEAISKDLQNRITGISYPALLSDSAEDGNAPINVTSNAASIKVDFTDLRYVSVKYYNFKGITLTGELICNKAIAQDLVEIFYALYRSEYQIEQIRLIDEYNGDDTLSMQDNNTSCFNYRVVDGTTNLSKHAYGLAIDINPFYNPYVVPQKDGSTYISPQGSEDYVDRTLNFPYKIDENDLCYRLFTERGFIWGGNWNSMKDYQHFQKTIE